LIYTVNKSANPYNGLNVHLRALEKTGLTKHKIGFSYNDDDLQHADLLILGNYLPQDVFSIATNLRAKKKIGYLFCSPFGQAGCNNELPLLLELMRMLDDEHSALSFLFCANKEMVTMLDHDRVKYLPTVSDFEGIYIPANKREGISLIGNNLRTSRNFPSQLAAIKLAQMSKSLYEPIMSYNMPNQAFEFFKALFKIDNWTNHEGSFTETEKKKIVASSRLGMQVTYSDAFNIAAYEYAMCHVPCLISSSLRWGVEHLRVKKIDSPSAIANAITTSLMNPSIGDAFRDAGKGAMDKNFEICEQTLKSCL